MKRMGIGGAHRTAAAGPVPKTSRPVSAADLALMRRIDELHPESPFAGGRLFATYAVRAAPL
jgi:hypothetical protein